MILRDRQTHWEVEMFHIVNVGKKQPHESFKIYLIELMAEFDKELTSTFYSMATGQPRVPATQSHHLVDDNGKEINIQDNNTVVL